MTETNAGDGKRVMVLAGVKHYENSEFHKWSNCKNTGCRTATPAEAAAYRKSTEIRNAKKIPHPDGFWD